MAGTVRRLGWRLKDAAKTLIGWLVVRTGLARLLGPRLHPNRSIILVFHTVGSPSTPAYPGNVLPEEAFRACLDTIANMGLPVVPLEVLVEDLLAGRDRGARVALTFDDGYTGCLEAAAPILAEYGHHSTFFVCPGFIDGRAAKWDDFLYLASDRFDKRILRASKDEVDRTVDELRRQDDEGLYGKCAEALLDFEGLRELQSRGFEIGSHTLNHYFLSRQDEACQTSEIGESKARLDDELDRQTRFLAYPFGFEGCYNDTTKRAAEEAGYDAAFALEGYYADTAEDRYSIGRFGISPALPNWRLQLILSGLHF